MNVTKIALETFYQETEDLIYSHLTVPEKHNNDLQPNWPLEFYRDHVSKNIPLLIKNGCKSFPAVSKWNSDYFLKKENPFKECNCSTNSKWIC